MIRLMDCEVYAVEKMDITRSWLFSFFCKGHTEDLVVVYSEGIYEGVISYKKLLNTASENIDDIMDKEKYICKSDDFNLFLNLSKIFRDTQDSLVTLMNPGGSDIIFCI